MIFNIKTLMQKIAPVGARFVRAAIPFVVLVLSQPAFAVVDVNKSFNPINVTPGQISTLTIHLYNSNSIADATGVAFTDTLPTNVLIATSPNITYSCTSNGVALATPVGTLSTAADSLSLSGGVIPMAVGTLSGSCTISVDVVSNTPATYVNTIPIGAVTSSEPANIQEAKATMVVKLYADLQVSKVFDKTVLHGGDSGTYTITLTNPNSTGFTGLGFTDTLPSQMQLANTITSTTCGGNLTDGAGAALVAGSATIKLSGGALAAGGSCAITFVVTPSNVQAYTNGIVNNVLPANSITTLEGATKATDTLGPAMMQVSAQVGMVFSPAIITAGRPSTMTLTLNNYNLADITNAGLTNNLPAGVSIVAGTTPTTTCTGGNLASSTSTSLVLTGATIPAATGNVLGGGTCTITAQVTAMPIASTTYPNSIWANFLNGFAFPDVLANLTVNTPITVTKAFSHNLNPLYFTQDRMPQTGVSTLTISLNNASVNPANINSFLDDLATMNAGIVAPAVGGISIAASPAATTDCGGTLTATAGTTPIALSGGVIPANGSCTITVPIAIAGNAENGVHFWRTNTIYTNALQTSEGNNTVDVSAQLGVLGAMGIFKSYSPTVVAAGGVSRLSVSVYRVEGAAPLNNVGVTDNLPPGHTVAAQPNISNNCGGTVTATPGASSFSLAGGSLPATPGNASITCIFAVDVRAPNTVGADTNVIDYNTVTTAERVTNMNTQATATLTRVVLPAVTLNKSFTPTSINGGNISRLDITIANTATGAVSLTNATLVDNLPAGTEIATNPNPTFTGGAGCSLGNGTITAVPQGTQLQLSGGNVGALATCTLSVNVTSTVGGNHINSLASGAFTSAEGSSNANAPSATLNVLQNANVGIVFSPAQIETGGTSTMTLIIYNSNTFNLNGTSSNALTNTLPSGMTVAAGAISTTCSGGTAVAAIGGNSVRIDGGIFPASSSCTITVPITAVAGASYTNSIPIHAINTTQGATNPDPTSATLAVIAKPNSMWKYFSPASIGVGETSVLNLSLTNTNPATLLPSGFTNVSFTDVLPAGMSIAYPQSAIYSCAGMTASFSAGQTTLNVTGLTIPPTTTCYLSVIVTTNSNGVFANTAGGISTGQTQTAGAVSNTALLTVLKRAQVTKSFVPSTIAPNGISTLTITLTNPNSADAITIATPGLTDTFPTGLTIATPLNASTTCAGGTLLNAAGGVLAAGNNGVRINGGSIPAGGSCTIVVDITASVLGNYVNITGLLASTNAGSSLTGGTATLAVSMPTQMSVTKSVVVISDPVNGTSNPKFIPGAIAEYTIVVSNAGSAPDADSVVINDVIPAHTTFMFSDMGVVGSGPVAFVQGTPTSTLIYAYPADLSFSNNYGASFVYAPSAGCDAQVTNLKMHPKGVFVGNASLPNPSFQLKFRVCVN